MSLIDRASEKHSLTPKPTVPAKGGKPIPKRKKAIAELQESFEDDALLDVATNAQAKADQEDFVSKYSSTPEKNDGGLMGRVIEDGHAEKPKRPSSPMVARKTTRSKDEENRQSREFELRFERLKKFGFITPKMRRSRLSEEFRLIKRRLMQRMSLSRTASKRQRGREHVILVTSARPSEGKSFVAVNLALSIVLDEGLNVMLVDGDVARPSISKIFGLRNDLPGLTDLLLGDAGSLPEVLLREKKLPLSLLAAGAVVPSATDLFSSEAMHGLVNDMASRYSDRIIIFDAPPLLASTEPVALASHAGQIVMAIDAQRTTRTAIDSALDLLETDQNVNLVLNKTTVGNRTEQFGSYYEAYNQIAS